MNTPDEQQQPEPQAGPGERLRQRREALGRSVDDVVRALKLTPKQVRAMEADDFQALGGDTFARGWVRNYARYLGLDAVPLVEELERRLGHHEVTLSPPSNAAGQMPSGARRRPLGRAVGFAAAAALIGAAAFFGYEQYGEWQQTGVAPAALPSPVPGARPASPPPAAPAQPAADPAPAPEIQPGEPQTVPVLVPPAVPVTPEPEPKRLSFHFDRESWLEVKDASGAVIASGNQPAGASQVVEGHPPFTLVIGNAPHVKLQYEDRSVDLKPHTDVKVARLTLD